MRILLIFAAIGTFLTTGAYAFADFGLEDAGPAGVTDPSDSSWRAYHDEMIRFPDRLGIICYNAYILNKTPDHKAALAFFKECADRGNAASMINLAAFYDDGLGVPKDPVEATRWLAKAAQTGYSAGEFDYGLALLRGHGIPRDEDAGRSWIRKAAEQGDVDAKQLMQRGFNPPTN